MSRLGNIIPSSTLKNVSISDIIKNQDAFSMSLEGFEKHNAPFLEYHYKVLSEYNPYSVNYIQNYNYFNWILYNADPDFEKEKTIHKKLKQISFAPINTDFKMIPQYIKKHLSRADFKKRTLEHFYLSAFTKNPNAHSAYFKNNFVYFYDDENVRYIPNSQYTGIFDKKSWFNSMFISQNLIHSCFDVHVKNPFINGSNHTQLSSQVRALELQNIFGKTFIKWKRI